MDDKTIIAFLDTATPSAAMKDQALRADSAGTLQALVGLWQIFCRQGGIPPAEADATLAGIITPFAQLRRDREVFEAARNGVKLLLKPRKPGNGFSQARLLELLAGTANRPDVRCARASGRRR